MKTRGDRSIMWFLANIVLAVHILLFLLLGASMAIAAI